MPAGKLADLAFVLHFIVAVSILISICCAPKAAGLPWHLHHFYPAGSFLTRTDCSHEPNPGAGDDDRRANIAIGAHSVHLRLQLALGVPISEWLLPSVLVLSGAAWTVLLRQCCGCVSAAGAQWTQQLHAHRHLQLALHELR